MTSRFTLSLVCFACALMICSAGSIAAELPDYFLAKPGSLAKALQRYKDGDKDLAKAVKNVIKSADEALAMDPPSVMAKTATPPSGDKHDYLSLAPYFWPDEKAKDGLPYLRHDGKVNPESRDEAKNDSTRIRLMGDSIDALALGFFFSREERYATKAAALARAWFLDPATRMNPNLKYAQAVRGVNDGRGTGILEGRHIAIAADALRLLEGSEAWTAKDRDALNAWLETYLDWLLNSEAGHDEHNAKNNHGTYYDVQSAHLALCLGKQEVAKRIIAEARQRRVAVQIEPDGRQPLELARTTSFSYSRFNLEALCELATLGEHSGEDLWNFSTEDGRGIRKAIDYMLPYVDVPAKEWPLKQIKDKHEDQFMPILRQAALAYGDPKYVAIISKYEDSRSKRFQVLFAK